MMMKLKKVLLLLIFIDKFFSSTAGKSSGTCISPGGRFPSFSSEGRPPDKVSKGPKDLVLCRVFRKNTCCDVSQTYPALLAIRRLASTGEANQECLHLWELLECSICDPHVGVLPGPPMICASFCDMVLKACADAYFSMDIKTRALSPCGSNDVVCGKLTEWTNNGTELCLLAGFSVQLSGDIHQDEVPICYGGKANLDSIANSWKTSRSKSLQTLGVIKDFEQWVSEMTHSERVSWAIGGMVLTAGLIFVSKRKSHNYCRKQAAVLRAAKRLEAKGNQQSPVGSLRGVRR
ncbi:hypothetical protein QJS10_CPB17g01263 [Acorus calamus]|uniref:Folate receptor-like domain-containing protein n=1 Tax=Acorus calamus TaxID=4465 RepID=A0AAV9CYV8_ACOCL|nr:hypothetical protein QJS10_CPB17g01263 [Acorus calamus]